MALPKPTLQLGGSVGWHTKEGALLGIHHDEAKGIFKPIKIGATRNSAGWRINRNGIWERKGDNYPRIMFDENAQGQLISEDLRTNAFGDPLGIGDTSSLGRRNCGYTLGGSFGSFNTSNLITSTAFTGDYIQAVYGYNAVTAEENWFTFNVKYKSGWYINLLAGNGGGSSNVQVNMTDGSFIDSSGEAASGNYRLKQFSDYFEISFPVVGIATTPAGLINIRFYNNASFVNYDDAGGTTFQISGAQWEKQVSYPSTLILTGEETRAADTFQDVINTELFPTTSGSITFKGRVNQEGEIFTLSRSTVSSIFLYLDGSGLRFFLYDNVNGNQTFTFDPTYVLGTEFHFGITFETNSVKAFLNGVKVYDSSAAFSINTPWTIFRLYNVGFVSGSIGYGRISQMKIWRDIVVSEANMITETAS